MSQAYPLNEQEYLTPPEYPQINEEKERKKEMIREALHNLNECISNLYSLDEDSLAMDLEEFRQSIMDLEEE